MIAMYHLAYFAKFNSSRDVTGVLCFCHTHKMWFPWMIQRKNPCLIGVGSCKIQPSFRSGSVSLVSKGEGGPSVFYLLNISKCSGPPRPIPFGRSLSISTTIRLSTYRKSCSSVTGHILGIQSRRRLMSNFLYSARDLFSLEPRIKTSTTDYGYKAALFMLNVKVNWFFLKLNIIVLQKVGVFQRSWAGKQNE